MSNCGGRLAADKIRSSETIVEAVALSKEVLFERRILVIVDNVWNPPPGSSVTSWGTAFADIATYPGSAVIITTRLEALSAGPGVRRVSLGRLNLEHTESNDWRISENLYDYLLQYSADQPLAEKLSNESYVRTRRRALKLSCGLPIAISSFVALVRVRRSKESESLLSKIEKSALGLADEITGKLVSEYVGHPGLFAAKS